MHYNVEVKEFYFIIIFYFRIYTVVISDVFLSRLHKCIAVSGSRKENN